jgi:hypothetical protein
MPSVLKFGSLNLLVSFGPVQASQGLLYFYGGILVTTVNIQLNWTKILNIRNNDNGNDVLRTTMHFPD